MKTEIVESEPSWTLHSDRVSLAVTRDGGQLGPAQFSLPGGRLVSPLHCAPWAGEKLDPATPPILRVLRGDFFCMPFGGNSRVYRGESHPVHGETANERWKFLGTSTGDGTARLHLALETKIRPAHVEKLIALRAGETAVYSRHTISGGRGKMNFGHHAMLALRGTEGLVSVAPFVRGQVFPGEFENPVQGGYSALMAGAFFSNLSRVPMATGDFADLGKYPAREGLRMR